MSARTIPTRADIEAARARIAPHVRRTPVLEVGPGAFGSDGPLALKLELLQVTGSFKPRGAFNRMLTADVGPAGVVAASGGNFGLAVGHAARELGRHAEIVVPSSSPAAKIDKVRATGAEVQVVDGYYDEAAAVAAATHEETGAVRMHPYDQPAVVAGQGTIGAELDEQVPSIDTVLVAVGGGGLIAGIASWFAGVDVRVIGVEPSTSRSMHAALESGRARGRAGVRARRGLPRHAAHRRDRVRGGERGPRRARGARRGRRDPRGAAGDLAHAQGVRRARGRRGDGRADERRVPAGADERIVVLICGANGDLRDVVV